MMLKLYNPDVVTPPLGRYTHVVETPPGARLLYLSGQVPVAPDGSVPESLAAQADQVYANIVAILADRGAPPSNIIKLTTFVTEDDGDADSVRKARAKYLGEHRPASTAVFVSRLVDPSWKIEIEAVALLAD
ncbi:MAG: RidA family protein [Hyphomonadaceae bacterium]|nr:RidA family protein [Hyphomonadaceae bacterium]